MNMKGSQQNDIFYNDNGKIAFRTNRSGGIQGGISNGQDIYFKVAFKPVATVLMEQPTVDKDGNETILKARGRHDPWKQSSRREGAMTRAYFQEQYL